MVVVLLFEIFKQKLKVKWKRMASFGCASVSWESRREWRTLLSGFTGLVETCELKDDSFNDWG